MITEPTWRTACEMLSARYQRDIPVILSALYLEQIAAELNDAQLIDGIKGVIRHREFFPTVQQIIDAAREAVHGPAMDLKIQGQMIFHELLASPSGYSPEGGTFWSVAAIRARYSEAVVMAFNAIGGAAQIKRCTPDSAPFMARDFAAAYAEAAALERSGLVLPRSAMERPTLRINRGPESLKEIQARTSNGE